MTLSSRSRCGLALLAALAMTFSALGSSWTSGDGLAADVVGRITTLPFAEARPIIETLQDDLPAALRSTARDLATAWPVWISAHHASARARLLRGDEDSVINLWYYGTSFTGQPRLSVRNVTALGGNRGAEQRILFARLDDLMAGIEAPGRNERLQFARDVVDSHGINPATAEGKEHARRFLLEASQRMRAEYESRTEEVESSKRIGDADAELTTHFTLFRDRGLSSDTLLLSSVSVDRALAAAKNDGVLPSRRIRRVGVVGPGLDFTDKADGYDFYPQQTLQPFALVDSLLRLDLAAAGNLQLTTFDLSPRVNRHLERAVARARSGKPYVIQLPLDRDGGWRPDVLQYWKDFGGSIGTPAKAIAAPREVGNVEVRAVTIRPEVVRSIDARKLDIVVERLETVQADQQYDLIVGTNILVYYDVFEQNLALANVARMLRPGGLFLSNTRVSPAVALTLLDRNYNVPHDDGQGDHMFVYLRPEE